MAKKMDMNQKAHSGKAKKNSRAFEREKRAILERPYGDHRNQAPDISHSCGFNRQAPGIRLLGTAADLRGDQPRVGTIL